jgi:hypothetical protein
VNFVLSAIAPETIVAAVAANTVERTTMHISCAIKTNLEFYDR